MSKKQNYFKLHCTILVSKVTICVSISALALVVGKTIGIASPAIGLKMCLMTTGIKH